MNIEIRVLTKNDAAAYKQLRELSFSESPLAFSESMEDEPGKSEAAYAGDIKPIGIAAETYTLGAFTGEHKLVSILTFKRDRRFKARHKAMIHAMYTHPDYRHKGIGQQLLQESIRRAKEMHGLEQIHLWVLHSGTSVTDFYRQAGFQSQGTMVQKDLKIGDTYVDAEYMALYLDTVTLY